MGWYVTRKCRFKGIKLERKWWFWVWRPGFWILTQFEHILMLMSFLTLIDKSLSFSSFFERWLRPIIYRWNWNRWQWNCKGVRRYKNDGSWAPRGKTGLNRDLNPGPLAPKARIIPLDHWALFDFPSEVIS